MLSVPYLISTNAVPRTSTPTGVIAFHSYLSIDSSGTLTRYYVLKFDKVPLNNGYGYNSFDDIFTVSFTGTYLFTWSFKSDVDGYVFTELTKNTDVIRNRFAGSLNSPVYNFSTGIVVAYVNQGGICSNNKSISW